MVDETVRRSTRSVAGVGVAGREKPAAWLAVLTAKSGHGCLVNANDQKEHRAFTHYSRSKVIGNVKTTEDVALVDILLSFPAHDHVP